MSNICISFLYVLGRSSILFLLIYLLASCSVGVLKPDDLQERKYENAWNIEKSGDYRTAFKKYLVLAENGFPPAQFKVGYYFWKGIGVSRNVDQAINWFEKSSDYIYSAKNLGIIYVRGDGHVVDYEKGWANFRTAAEQGDLLSVINMGHMLQNGKGVEKDVSLAFEIYRSAAKRGHPLAKTNLGICYEYGIGIEKSVSKALAYYQDAVDDGYQLAFPRLGKFYYEGKGVKQDLLKAGALFRAGAALNDHNALIYLGVMYGMGQGVPKDVNRAVSYYTKAIELGYSNTFGEVWQVYQFIRDAKNNSLNDSYFMAVLYARGVGVEPDKKLTKMWLNKSKKLASSKGIEFVDNYAIEEALRIW